MPQNKGWFSDGVLYRRKQEKPELLPPEPMQVYMPEGINFDELWKDEEEEKGGGIQLIIAIVNIVLLVVILIKSFF